MISSAPPGVPARAREKRPPIGRNSAITAESQTTRVFAITNLLNRFRQPPGEKDNERGKQQDRGRRRKRHTKWMAKSTASPRERVERTEMGMSRSFPTNPTTP